ncbi:SURF1 family protein [Microbacterium sp. P07]|uniref:SURF1 family protein n=1 Tax=Microbacterium sp. P07 TaxID=3366952 RepID=UPI003746EC1D
MVRPRWIGVLFVCLVVAGAFAWLGQWQLSRAIDTSPAPPGATEQVRPIDEVVAPGEYLPEPLVGQQVEVSGQWIPEDFLVVSTRFNDDVEGYWVTGQLRVSDQGEPVSLAVAVGWTSDRERADAAASALSEEAVSSPVSVDLTGRIISDEGPGLPPGADPQEMPRMSPAALLARWHDVEDLEVYRPYLTASEPLGGLDAISSPAPAEGSNVNWLNIFYAAEWAVFAGFAFYLWYRLARDAWEKEVEDLDDEAAAAS